jgi:ribosome recycling factor
MAVTDDVVKDLKGRIRPGAGGPQARAGEDPHGRASLSRWKESGQLLRHAHTSQRRRQLARSRAAAHHREALGEGLLKDVEKALREANLGLTPMNDGEIIRLPIPPLTEERRKEIAKQVKTKGEEHKVAIRNERRGRQREVEALLKDKKITEDENNAPATGSKGDRRRVSQVDQSFPRKRKR